MSSGLALIVFAGSASAHVSVIPQVSASAAWETYTIKVPVEKELRFSIGSCGEQQPISISADAIS